MESTQRSGSRAVEERRRRSTAGVAAARGVVASPVTPIKLAGGIPRALGETEHRLTARLALLLLDVGLLTERHWRRDAAQLAAVCRKALTEWIDARVGPLECLHPIFLAGAGYVREYDAFGGSTSPTLKFWIEWYATEPEILVVGPRVEHLNRAHRNLGRVALQTLSRASYLCFRVFSGEDQLGLAEWLLWQGCSNEQECADQWGIEGEERAAFLEETITRAQIENKVPAWLASCGGKWEAKDCALERIARRSGDHLSREIAETILAIRRADQPYAWHRENEEQGGEFVGFSAITRWSDDDYAVDLYDRMVNSAFENGVSYEMSGAHGQSIDDLGALQGWLDEMRRILVYTRLVDHLLSLLAGRHCTEANV